MTFLGRAASLILDFLYPPLCLSCQESVASSQGLCVACWREIAFIERPYCERLGVPFAHDLGAGVLSPEALADPPAYGRARAAVRYGAGPAQKLVHGLKYADRTEFAGPMGHWMARCGIELLNEADVMVPVPLHRSRLLRRGFNQAAELAKAVRAVSGVPCDPLALERIKATRPQVGLTRAQRARNLEGAFRVPKAAARRIDGRRILLVDDVLTSGSTLDAAARALLRAGAASADALVFARVVNEG